MQHLTAQSFTEENVFNDTKRVVRHLTAQSFTEENVFNATKRVVRQRPLLQSNFDSLLTNQTFFKLYCIVHHRF